MAYPSTGGKIAGALLIILGFLSIGFFIPLMVFKVKCASPGHGIWTSTTYMNAGGFTIGVARAGGRCKSHLMASFALSILSIAFSAAEFSLGVAGAKSVDFDNYEESDLDKDGVIVLSSVIALLGFAALITSIYIVVQTARFMWCSNKDQEVADAQIQQNEPKA